MRTSVKMFATLLLVVMCLFATEMVVEGRTCLTKSHKFKGPCLGDTNCKTVCRTEGFPGGDCRGLRRRCFCTKHC